MQKINTQTTQQPNHLTTLLNESYTFVKNEDGKSQVIIACNDKKYYHETMAPYEYLNYIVVKKFVNGRDYLPVWLQREASWGLTPPKGRNWTDFHGVTIEDCRQQVALTIVSSLKANDGDNCYAIKECFKVLGELFNADAFHTKDYKTLATQENCNVDDVALIKSLCDFELTADQKFATIWNALCENVYNAKPTACGNQVYNELIGNNPAQSQSLIDIEKVKALIELFDLVKKAHKYLSDNAWVVLENRVLNKSNADIANALGIKTTKASKYFSDLKAWFLDEVKKSKDLADRLGL